MSRVTDTDRLTPLVGRFVTAYLQDFLQAAEGHGLTLTQAKVLLTLTEPPSALPMREIADRIACDASNITGVADRMEARGFLRREVNPADRRVKNLVATPEGLALAGRIRAEQHRTRKALADLTEPEATAFAEVLTRLLPTLETNP